MAGSQQKDDEPQFYFVLTQGFTGGLYRIIEKIGVIEMNEMYVG